jgi:hypothetical protein
VLRSTARCRLPRPDREVLSITDLGTDHDASPELALIDSTLRERLARTSPGPAPVRVPYAADASPEVKPGSRRIRLTALVVSALLVAIGGAWYLIARTGSPAKGSAPAANPRVFAWAPVAGIRTYAVEIRRTGDVIFAGRTTEPRLTLKFTLSRGTYQWYVWPIRPGSRLHEPAAIVAASFRVAR